MLHVRKAFGPTVALDDVSLAVHPGEVHALVGQNGAGKSTLMKILSGAIAPDGGTMALDGVPYAPRNPHQARRAGVAMIYQELSLAPHLSVTENILLGMEHHTFGLLHRRRMREVAASALAQLGHPDIPLDAAAATLSPAAQQLVEIARALANQCRVLVLDEPTSSLTQSDVQKLFDLIRRLRAGGLAIVYISHFLEEIKAISDRFTVLRDGRTVGTGPTANSTPDQIVSLMVGRSLEQLYPRSPRTPGEPVLDISGLSGRAKPRDVSLVLHRGEVLGIAGLVGAGRTELLRAIFGLDPVRSGTIKLATVRALSAGGLSIATHSSPRRRWAQRLGFLSEDRKTEGLALNLSLADNLTLSDLSPFGPAGLVLPHRQRAAAGRWTQALAIKSHSPAQPVAALSGGNQQKVALARLLHHDADILLLDEPTRGIDVASKATIYQLIDALATGRAPADAPACPKAILIVSSYAPELLGICDRIAVMHRGLLGPARPVGELTEHQLTLEATAGPAHNHLAVSSSDVTA